MDTVCLNCKCLKALTSKHLALSECAILLLLEVLNKICLQHI